MSDKPTESLTAALALVQAKLPEIRKSGTAEIKSDKGSYKYRYADLAAVTKAVLPLLAEHGLTWVTRPTLVDGRLILAYALRHISGDELSGEYPLTGGTPQQIGSAITYARRYTLCSVTGVAPESDDDDAAAAMDRQPARDEWEAAKPAAPEQVQLFDELAAQIAAESDPAGIHRIGERVRGLRQAGEIAPVQYDHLARHAAARLAELAEVTP